MMPRMLGMRCSAMPLAALTTTGKEASTLSRPPAASRVAFTTLPSTSNDVAKETNEAFMSSASMPPTTDPLWSMVSFPQSTKS